jgi:acetyl-CoA carboxylase biotin carboxyl carrier protein
LAHETLTYEDLLQIVEIIKSSAQFSEFRLKIGEIEIELKRRQNAASTAPAFVAPDDQVQAEAPAPAPHHAPAAASAADWPAESVVVRAPMMGTFYRSPAPGAPPFVSIGQAVEAGTTVCIIEVMKLMNSIPAGVSGVVTHVLAEDAQSVEADAPLIVVDPRRTSA